MASTGMVPLVKRPSGMSIRALSLSSENRGSGEAVGSLICRSRDVLVLDREGL